MQSLFWELSNRELNGWEPSPGNDPFQNETEKQKEGAMQASLRFICEFFSSPSWIWKYQPAFNKTWITGYEICKTTQRQSGLAAGHIRIRILADQLYDIYKSWNKDKNPGSRNVYEKTFFKHIEKIGIVKVARLRINDSQRTCCDLFYIKIRGLVREIFPTYDFPQWATEIPTELAIMDSAMNKPMMVDE